jgi:hypothetical protein
VVVIQYHTTAAQVPGKRSCTHWHIFQGDTENSMTFNHQHTHFTQYTAQKKWPEFCCITEPLQSSLWPVHVMWQLQWVGYLMSTNKSCSVKWQKSITEDLNLQQHCCRNFRSCKRISLYRTVLEPAQSFTCSRNSICPSQTTTSPILSNINPLHCVLWCL